MSYEEQGLVKALRKWLDENVERRYQKQILNLAISDIEEEERAPNDEA